MAKQTKPAKLPATEVKSDNVVAFELNDDVRSFATRLGVDITAPLSARADSAADHMSRSQMHMLGAGLLLASIKVEAPHGEFGALIAERGFEERAAQRAMLYAQFVLSRPADERDRLLAIPKSRVLELAAADPQVIEVMLADGGEELTSLSVRALAARIREMEAQLADSAVQLETAQAHAKAAQKALAREKDRVGEVPIAVFDIRAEAVAHCEKARLAVDEFDALGRDLAMLIGIDGVSDWVGPSARLVVSGMLALRVQLDGAIQKYADSFGLLDVRPEPISYLVPEEVEAAAKKFADLIAVHQHEKAMRDWQRQQERPRGKGRPASKPEAPKLTAA